MTLREFLRFHLLKALIALVVLQMIIIAIIQNFNHRPNAIRDAANVIEERTVKITPLSNDTDKDDNEELSVQNVLSPLNGKVEQNKNLLYYTPSVGFVGVDSFAYTVSDGKKESNQGYVVITVNKNLEPVGNKDSVGIYVGGVISIDVLGNDEDREDDSIFIAEYTNAKFGKLKLSEGKLVYTAGNSAQLDSFHYIVSDGRTNSEKITVLINVMSKNSPSYPWLSMDIGNYAIPGSFEVKNNKIIVKASGRDIWNELDGFRYVYQQISGDFEMVAKVDSLIGSHQWVKGTLMARESLAGGSKASVLVLSTQNGATVHNRFTANERMEGTDKHPEGKSPYWLKLTRQGDTFNYFISPDGIKWKKMETIQNPMSKSIYLGFGVTSHDNNELGKAVFSNFKIMAK